MALHYPGVLRKIKEADMNRRIKNALKFLGGQYGVKVIDCVPAIYLDLYNGHDIEVFGFYSRSGSPIHIVVWQVKPFREAVEKIDVRGLPELKAVLDDIEARYGGGSTL